MKHINNIHTINLNNSAYVRIKIRNRPIVAKMLIDSGNLVNDLISEEFAKILKVKYTPLEKQVGTAEKGGSVKIIGKSEPIKIFIEGVPQGVIIQPLIVKDLSHPVNVGRDFLGRNGGKLEFTPTEGYIEINKTKVRMIKKNTHMTGGEVIDSRFQKVFRSHGSYVHLDTGMIYEGTVNQCEDDLTDPVKMFNKTEAEIPAMSGMFVPITTNGKMLLKNARKYDLCIEPCEHGETPVLVVPGTGKLLKNEAYCFVVNPETRRIKLTAGSLLGMISLTKVIEPTIQGDDESLNFIHNIEDRTLRQQVMKDLKISENPLMKGNSKLQGEVLDLFCQYGDIISRHEFDYGHTTEIQCHIQLKPGEETPVKMKARPLNPAQEDSLRKQIHEWERGGIIEKTQSPWAFPMVGVKKKNSDITRWCVDYRLLNQKTVKDAYPLQSIENNLHKLQGAKIFSTLDSAGAYHAVEIHPESRECTAFTTPFGQFQFARMPFGLSNAGACYSRLVSMALQYLPGPFALAYLDDIVIYSSEIKEHLQHLEEVLKLHRQFGMKLRLPKCKVLQREVEYLGHLVSQEGIQMIPTYVQKILDWPLPQTGKELKQFLGFVGYYRGFIPDIAELTFEMNDMKKGSGLKWDAKVEQKFEQLKKRFESAPLRCYPDYTSEEPFILDTDFSSTALAAVLSQIQEGKESFIGAGARKCNKAEQNYPSHKGELAAAVMGLRKFEHILRFKTFILRTDSRCMQFLDSLKEVRGIYARWLNFIQGFDFKVVHRPGVKNQNADPLSRMERMQEGPEDVSTEEIKDQEEDVYQIEAQDLSNMTGEEIIAWQERDPVLRTVITWVRMGEKPCKGDLKEAGREYQVYAGIFECLKIPEGRGLIFDPTDGSKPRICAPQDSYSQIFKWAHEHQTAGHFGMNATQKKIRERFFLPGLTNKIVTSVTNCIGCVQKRNYVNKDQHIFHRSLESRPFQKIYVDLVGPLPEGEWQGKKVNYILTMMDGFTKWSEAIPVSDITALTVAKNVVEHWVARYGIPEQIHSDRGVQFTSELYKEVMRLFGILATLTPPYNPRSNKVERLHRILGDVLRSDQTGTEVDWPTKLPLVLFAHRTTISRTTGVTPFQAMFGVNSRIPLDVIFPTPRGEPERWPDYVSNLQQNLQKIYDKMRTQGQIGLARATAYQTGKVAKAIRVEEGDTVYYFSPRVIPGRSGKTHRKLALLWTGPYQVRRVLSTSLCIIYPFGEWAKNPREIVTVVDKLRIIRNPIPETALRPEQRIDLDEVEESLDDYGEFIQQNITDPSERGIPVSMGLPQDEIIEGSHGRGGEGDETQSGPSRPSLQANDPIETPTPNRQMKSDEVFPSSTGVPQNAPYQQAFPKERSRQSTGESDIRETESNGERERERRESDASIQSEFTNQSESLQESIRTSDIDLATPTGTESKFSSQSDLREFPVQKEGKKKGKETKYSPYPRAPQRKAAQLAEFLLRAGASKESLAMKQKKTEKGSQKRKMSENVISEQQEKKERVQEEEEKEEDRRIEIDDPIPEMVVEEDDLNMMEKLCEVVKSLNRDNLSERDQMDRKWVNMNNPNCY